MESMKGSCFRFVMKPEVAALLYPKVHVSLRDVTMNPKEYCAHSCDMAEKSPSFDGFAPWIVTQSKCCADGALMRLDHELRKIGFDDGTKADGSGADGNGGVALGELTKSWTRAPAVNPFASAGHRNMYPTSELYGIPMTSSASHTDQGEASRRSGANRTLENEPRCRGDGVLEVALRWGRTTVHWGSLPSCSSPGCWRSRRGLHRTYRSRGCRLARCGNVGL